MCLGGQASGLWCASWEHRGDTSAWLWKAVSGPWADHKQAEESLANLIFPRQGWDISEGWVQGQPWAP